MGDFRMKQGSSGKGLIPGLWQEEQTMSLEYLGVPESKNKMRPRSKHTGAKMKGLPMIRGLSSHKTTILVNYTIADRTEHVSVIFITQHMSIRLL